MQKTFMTEGLQTLIPGFDLEGWDDAIATAQKRVEQLGCLKSTDTFMPEILKWIERSRETPVRQAMRRIRGNALVDLGPGTSLGGYILAQHFGASAYIGVEAFHSSQQVGQIRLLEEVQQESDDPLILWHIAPNDMLNFLRRMPDASACVMAANIDGHVLPYNYQTACATEITRVVMPGGLYASLGSDIEPQLPSITEEFLYRAYLKD